MPNSPEKPKWYFISAKPPSNKDGIYRVFYSGQSMVGTFRDGDWLWVERATLKDLKPGDVVLYQCLMEQGFHQEIVHRVMCFAEGGIILRGDSNPRNDINIVFEQDILGRAVQYERNKRLHPIANGLRGLAKARLLHWWYGSLRILWRGFKFCGRVPYRWFKYSGVVKLIWQPPVQRILLQTPDGPLVKYVSRGRTVARWWPEQKLMFYVRPYDLIIPFPDDSAHD